MALSNAERQKRYREKRKTEVSELEKLRNENAFLKSELEKLLNEFGLPPIQMASKPSETPVKPRYKPIKPKNLFFFVKDGQLDVSLSNTMNESLVRQGVNLLIYDDLVRKHKKEVDALVRKAELNRISSYNKKVAAWNPWASANGFEVLDPIPA
ncbi:bZIP transcription factor [Alkalimonas sp. NCh-2]|uniref:bZIP transcription factor n=1 Tax=Alkalimonas sp. NCh-2 TaxID=3144846 RepID=UPI0031F69807